MIPPLIRLVLALMVLVCGVKATCKMPSMRPAPSTRRFTSSKINSVIESLVPRFKDPNLATLFSNAYPNTLDTTVELHGTGLDGELDTFIVTGDIAAMWLRDSTNQVLPYVPYINDDSSLDDLVVGLIHRQLNSVLIDQYANAFNLFNVHQVDAKASEFSVPYGSGPHQDDSTSKPGYAGTRLAGMTPAIFERKYELDSLVNVLNLAVTYWETTKSTSPFTTGAFEEAVGVILNTFQYQQSSTLDVLDNPVYDFQRLTTQPTDSLSHGRGQPAKYTGMVKTGFRPSDDAHTFPFNVPGNAYAVAVLTRIEPMLSALGLSALQATATKLVEDIETGIAKFGIVNHPALGQVYAYEVDGYGNHIFMDDANVPSLLSLPYLGYVNNTNALYLRTRAGVLSDNNPYWFKGSAGSGIGGPHVGLNAIWPMSLIVQALTSTNETEILDCLNTLIQSSACTGLIHESFNNNDFGSYTRPWFAWANSLFGHLVLYIADKYPTMILNS